MKRITGLTITVLALAFLSSQSAFAAARTWVNTAGNTDYNASTSWNAGAGPAPTTGDVGQFTAAEVAQPNVSTSVSNSGLYFNGAAVNGYDITGGAGVTLTLTGRSTSGSSGTSDSSAAAIRADNTAGTNTIDVPLILSPTTGSTFVQAGGGKLVVNGNISSSAGINLSLRGGGEIDLNGNNSFATGSIDTASEVVVVGNNNALGAGAFSVNNSATLQAGGGARTLANNIVFGATTTIGGSNDITFSGNASTSGANSRTVTVNNTGATNFNGTFTINGNASAGLVVNGTGNATINGSIVDGVPAGGTLSHGGTGTLSLTNSNTFSGGSLLSGGTTISTSNGAFGTGNVSLTANNVTLTLQGVTNSIADNANLSIGILANTGDVVNLNYTGTETIGALFINGTQEAAGQWGAPGSGAANTDPTLAGTGFLNVTVAGVPEPSTLAMIAVGAASLIGAQIRRKRS